MTAEWVFFGVSVCVCVWGGYVRDKNISARKMQVGGGLMREGGAYLWDNIVFTLQQRVFSFWRACCNRQWSLILLLACRSAEEIAESPITKHAPGFQDFTSPLKGKKKRQLPIAPRRRGRAASGEDEGEEEGRGMGEHHITIGFCEVQVCLSLPNVSKALHCSFIFIPPPSTANSTFSFAYCAAYNWGFLQNFS